MVDEGSKDPKSEGRANSPPTSSRFQRFAKLTGLGASVTARHLGQRIAGAFSSAEQQEERERKGREKTATQMRETLGELKGAAMKVGQMLATDPELLPEEIVRELATLQHSAPAMDFQATKAVVEKALERPLDEVFESFSEQPIGAASIGQVHRARTKDGQDVAVKVQYPGIADTLSSDIKNLGSLLVMARATLPRDKVDGYLEEVRTVIEREGDYLKEAENLERFQVVLKGVEGVRVPLPVHELTRKNVLVMEFLDGVRLEDWLQSASAEDKTVQAQRLLRMYLQMIHEHGALHADPHPGNFLVLKQGSDPSGVPPIALLDLGCVRDYPVAFMDDMLQLLRGMWRHDLPALQRTWRKLGFVDDKVDPEVIYEWWELIFSPLIRNEVTDFGEWKIQEQAVKFLLEHPELKLFAPPREVIFYTRVLVGIRALMHKTQMKLNVYELSREVCRSRGVI
jgi:predicted unusual protein kinase regulating ubiquinone biosynthesis (AarF/ABC1/UbiB family)